MLTKFTKILLSNSKNQPGIELLLTLDKLMIELLLASDKLMIELIWRLIN